MAVVAGFSLQNGGTKAVTTAGARVQLTSAVTNANAVAISAEVSNTGAIYVGDITVSATDYVWLLDPGESTEIDLGPGVSINPSSIYIDSAVSTDGVMWGYI